jgi:hypothetical protein
VSRIAVMRAATSPPDRVSSTDAIVVSPCGF